MHTHKSCRGISTRTLVEKAREARPHPFPLLSVSQVRLPQPPTRSSVNPVILRYFSLHFLPIIASATSFTSISLINNA
ncbi:hypothetical protein Peur_058230 [Populus x canadensis]